MSEDSTYELLLPFDSDDPEFTRCKHTTFVVKGGTCTCLSCGHKWDDWKVWPRD